jgi:ERCC4-related helicase
MAGYFRSSSLAAASKGFSAFVENHGRIRMVVGAELAPADVAAILHGTEERMALALTAELSDPDGWPEDVVRGVELLGWMVAHGRLEIRVAFRVHAHTGKPLLADAVDDGYVHEKWAIFGDGVGDRVYISGSLNESRTALQINAENIEVHCSWEGAREKQRADEAEQAFHNLWTDNNPSMRVLPLPEAVRQRLIQFSNDLIRPREIDGSSVVPLKVDPPSALERLKFAVLSDGPHLPGGKYVGLETAPVTPWPHQEVVARRLIDSWPYSYLLCDEVGLGKTIEMGLAIRSLYLSGVAKRVLVAPPASLTEQWHREMSSKFLLPFGRAQSGPITKHKYLLPLEEEVSANSLYEPNLVIVSTGLVARKQRRAEIDRADEFDIAIVDEAHYASRRDATKGFRASGSFGHLYTSISSHLAPKSRALWLATATPMQMDMVQVADLIALTDRVGSFQFDGSLMRQYYEILVRLLQRTMPGRVEDDDGSELRESEWAFLHQALKVVEVQDPILWEFLERSVLDAAARAAAQNWLERGFHPARPDWRALLRVVYALSPLSRVMLRHTRSLLEKYREAGQLTQPLPNRVVLAPRTVAFTPAEREAYDQLEEYCQGLAAQVREHGSTGYRQAIGFYLSFLRLRFASSNFSLRETLRRRSLRVEATLRDQLQMAGIEDTEELMQEFLREEDESDDVAVESLLANRTPEDLIWERERLQAMLQVLNNIPGLASKTQALLEIIASRRNATTGRVEQTVIFTRFYDTLSDIVHHLRNRDPDVLIGTYSGAGGQYYDPSLHQMVGTERDRVKQRFIRGGIDILVCTDAAAEGLNLQTADLLINFDLPWNPMKVEQRVGRIDRIGQKHPEIYVLNVLYQGSAEETVYDRLRQRLSSIAGVVGSQQFTMLPVLPEEFERLADGTLTESQLEARATERAGLLKRRIASMELPPEDLYDIYTRLAQEFRDRPAPVTLELTWRVLAESRYLRDLGCRAENEEDVQILELANVPDLKDGTGLTPSRRTFEEGHEALRGVLHFASYGDPVFDVLLEEINNHALPTCVKRLTAKAPGVDAEIVGYAVACNDEVRLVTSLSECFELQLDEARVLEDRDVADAAAELRSLAAREFILPQASEGLQRRNVSAGRAQEILSLILAEYLLRRRLNVDGDGTLFWQQVKELDDLYADGEGERASGLRADWLRTVSENDPLFTITVPQVGDEGSVDAPAVLVRSAIDAACRVADGMREKRSDLTTEAVLRQLQRVMGEKLRELG